MNKEIDKDLDFTSLKPLEVLYEEAVEELSEKETKENNLPKIEVNLKNSDTVAVFAEGNIFQAKWGELKKGYNIVKKETADFWLAHRTVRMATPEEVAKHYGVK
jgi:hypothetical protein